MGIADRSSPPSLDQLSGLLSRCSLPLAADKSRRLSAPRVVSRPLAGHTPRTRFACARPFRSERGVERMPAGSCCDAGLMRRAPGTRPPTLRHGSSQPYTGLHVRCGTPPEDAETLRLGAAFDRAFVVDGCLHVLTFDPGGCSDLGSAHVCAALCRFVDLVLNIIHMYHYSQARTCMAGQDERDVGCGGRSECCVDGGFGLIRW